MQDALQRTRQRCGWQGASGCRSRRASSRPPDSSGRLGSWRLSLLEAKRAARAGRALLTQAAVGRRWPWRAGLWTPRRASSWTGTTTGAAACTSLCWAAQLGSSHDSRQCLRCPPAAGARVARATLSACPGQGFCTCAPRRWPAQSAQRKFSACSSRQHFPRALTGALPLRSVMYGKENPEWNTEKIRYFVELPGDAWADGSLMALVKQNMVAHPDAQGRIPYTELCKHNECRPELAVLDPHEACAPGPWVACGSAARVQDSHSCRAPAAACAGASWGPSGLLLHRAAPERCMAVPGAVQLVGSISGRPAVSCMQITSRWVQGWCLAAGGWLSLDARAGGRWWSRTGGSC